MKLLVEKKVYYNKQTYTGNDIAETFCSSSPRIKSSFEGEFNRANFFLSPMTNMFSIYGKISNISPAGLIDIFKIILGGLYWVGGLIFGIFTVYPRGLENGIDKIVVCEIY